MTLAPSNAIRLLCAGIFVSLACAFGAVEVQASIIVPDVEILDAAELLADLEDSGTSGSSSSSAPSKDPAEDPVVPELHALVAALLGSSTSNTSTSSSGGFSGSGNVPIHSSAAATSPDLDLVGWTNGEARFALPTPPGNDLLRPPQQARAVSPVRV